MNYRELKPLRLHKRRGEERRDEETLVPVLQHMNVRSGIGHEVRRCRTHDSNSNNMR
jgi:hypothetical protein